MAHDVVGSFEFADDAESLGVVVLELDESRLANEVASEEHAVAYLMLIQVGGQLGAGEGGPGFDCDFETEPRTVRAAAGGVPSEIGIRTGEGCGG